MTTNKPEVVSWGVFYRGVMQDFGYNEEATKAAAKLDFHGRTLSIEPLIRLSDYQRLQAECEKLRKDAVDRYIAKAPDVDVMIEALELISDTDPDEGTAWFHEIAYKALAAYRKGGE